VECSILARRRKTPVLRRGTFGCLAGIPSVNITVGCLLGCVYCYARGYPGAPGGNRVVLFNNLAEKLTEELKHKRQRPSLVLFNTASDSFQPHPDIIDVSVRVMEILLERGIAISLLTKGVIPRRFLEIARSHPGLVAVRIGIVSLDPAYQGRFERYAATPAERLVNIERLTSTGIIPEVRIDPVIPFITDTKRSFETLFGELAARGVRQAMISYLHLRPAIEKQVKKELDGFSAELIEGMFRGAGYKTVGASTMTKLIPHEVRRRGYDRAREAANRLGVTLSICSCKNPDMAGGLCVEGLGIGGQNRGGTNRQLSLLE
jgi:DNA repair photolyase